MSGPISPCWTLRPGGAFETFDYSREIKGPGPYARGGNAVLVKRVVKIIAWPLCAWGKPI